MSVSRAQITACWIAIVIALALMIAIPIVGTLSDRAPRRWIIKGRAATSDLDLNDVMFEKNALRRAAGTAMDSPSLLFNHEQKRPIGRLLSVRFERGEVWITAEVSRTEPDVWAKIRDGTLSGLSIAVVPMEAEPGWSDERGRPFNRLTEFVIVEVSVVSVPSNPRARITAHAEERGR